MRTTVIQARTGREVVFEVCRDVLGYGSLVSPRGRQTLEVSPLHIELDDPTDTLPDGINRAKLLPAIGAAEALQNIAGVAQPGLMSRISSFFPKPSDRWAEENETYGPRLGRQLDDVAELLRRDRDSREAVATIWRAGDIVGGQAHNLCTISLQFLVREGALDLLVTMRSNDAWYGLCYDLFQFAQVQLTMARCLGVPAGRYFHTAASMHLYDRHWAAASELTLPIENFPATPLWGIGMQPYQSWADARARAEILLTGGVPFGPTPTERWYADTLAPYEPDGS